MNGFMNKISHCFQLIQITFEVYLGKYRIFSLNELNELRENFNSMVFLMHQDKGDAHHDETVF